MNLEIPMSFTEPPTLELKFCVFCGRPIPSVYRFCRYCGKSQSFTDDLPETRRLQNRSNQLTDKAATVTMKLEPAPATSFRALSGAFVDSMVAGVSATGTLKIRNRIAKKAVTGLVSIPIWLMIVLLSPFDALKASSRMLEQA